MLLYHSTLQKTVIWYKKVGINIMEILSQQRLLLYAKNTTKPMKNSDKLDWFSSFKLQFEATNVLPPPLYYTTNRKKEKCCQSMQTLIQEPKENEI